LRSRHHAWGFSYRDGSYRAWHEDGTPLAAATADELTRAINAGRVRTASPEAPDDLSCLKSRHPRYWMQPVHEGYLAVPRGVCPILAPTIDELGKQLRLPG
jgi:hypothetical protein